MGGSCFPEIIPELRRDLKTLLDEDPGLEGVFGDGAGSKVRCKLRSKREEGNTREQRDLGREWGKGQTGADSSSMGDKGRTDSSNCCLIARGWGCL